VVLDDAARGSRGSDLDRDTAAEAADAEWAGGCCVMLVLLLMLLLLFFVLPFLMGTEIDIVGEGADPPSSPWSEGCPWRVPRRPPWR
jgi:hypothetical protein